MKKKRKKRFSESVGEEVSVKSEPREVTAQLESELGRASTAESPRKRKNRKESSDVKDEILLYVSKKVEYDELVKKLENV